MIEYLIMSKDNLEKEIGLSIHHNTESYKIKILRMLN